MAGIAEIALGMAPLAGGALLGAAAGNFKAPDIRAMITKDLDLMERLPPEQANRKAGLQRIVEQRIDGLIAAADRSESLRETAAAYRGDWRDIVLFICSMIFTFVWWQVPHSRADWFILFIALIALTVVTGVYAFRGGLRALRNLRGGGRQ